MSVNSTPLTDVDFSVRWRSHTSFGAAVNAVPAERKALADAINQRLRGATIQSVSYNGLEVCLRMSTGEDLVLKSTATGVEFQLGEAVAVRASEYVPPEDLRMRFPDGLEYDWNWRSWLSQLLNREFYAIAPRETITILHVRNAPELLFDSMVNLNTKNVFLFFSES